MALVGFVHRPYVKITHGALATTLGFGDFVAVNAVRRGSGDGRQSRAVGSKNIVMYIYGALWLGGGGVVISTYISLHMRDLNLIIL